MGMKRLQNNSSAFIQKDEFHEVTIWYMKETPTEYRKSKGQYFTPKSVIEKLLSKLPNKKRRLTVLDPGCGTGEFLFAAAKYFKEPKLYGWDIEEKLIKIAQKLVPTASLKVTDALKEETDEKFDFVIGNPPYFEFIPDRLIKNKYREVINGRPNIFSFFIKLGIDLLKDGGYLAFIVPPSMNNGAYFANLRDYIVRNSNIEFLSVSNGSKLFHEALQATMLLVLKKDKNKGDYIFKKNGIQIFTERPNYLERAFKDKTSLHDLGFIAKTGRLVWNQNKDLLTNDPQKGVPLIWAHNITSRGLQIPVKNRKPQYVMTNGCDTGPAIVVNRITGTVGETKLKAAIIPEGMKFIGENHVNVIFPPSKNEQLEIIPSAKKRKKTSLQDIVNQLRSKEKLEVIQYITGNTQISKTELENLFPIDFR